MRASHLPLLLAAGLLACSTTTTETAPQVDTAEVAPVQEELPEVETEAPAAPSLKESAGALIGIRNLEEPEHEVLQKDGAFELRAYEGMSVIRASDRRGEGGAFGQLFRYISGGNVDSTKIPMTAPALMRRDGGETTMVFVLPRSYSAETAPAPTSENVAVEDVDAARVATVRFSGFLSRENVARQTEKLERWIEEEGLTPLDEPIAAGYDPPYTLPNLRRNEIWVRVE